MRVLGVLIALLVVLAAPASAATVGIERQIVPQYKSGDAEYVTMIVRDDVGERNDITATPDGAAVVIRDAAARLRAGAECEALDEHRVRCAVEGRWLDPIIELGAGDDRLGGLRVSSASGGDGNDVLDVADPGGVELSGGPGDDLLRGNAGNDSLAGGTGADVLQTGAGNDNLLGDPPEGPYSSDILDAGGGERDVVSYTGRSVGVVVDPLTPGNDGSPGEGDAVSEAEHIHGTPMSDVIRGGEGDDEIDGGAGREPDVIIGRGGNDVIRGSGGADHIDGGDGDDDIRGGTGGDRILAGPGRDSIETPLPPNLTAVAGPDRISCGPGIDAVNAPALRDVVGPDCERVFIGGVYVSPPVEARRGYAARVLGFSDSEGVRACVVRMTVVTRRGTFRRGWIAAAEQRRLEATRSGRAPRGVPPPPPGRVRVLLETRTCGSGAFSARAAFSGAPTSARARGPAPRSRRASAARPGPTRRG